MREPKSKGLPEKKPSKSKFRNPNSGEPGRIKNKAEHGAPLGRGREERGGWLQLRKKRRQGPFAVHHEVWNGLWLLKTKAL